MCVDRKVANDQCANNSLLTLGSCEMARWGEDGYACLYGRTNFVGRTGADDCLPGRRRYNLQAQSPKLSNQRLLVKRTALA